MRHVVLKMQSKFSAVNMFSYIPSDDPILPIASVDDQDITNSGILDFLSRGNQYPDGSTNNSNGLTSGNIPVSRFNSFSNNATYQDSETAYAYNYSYGSYNGSYDIFNSLLSTFGFGAFDGGSGFTVNPGLIAQIQTSFLLSQNLPQSIGDINSGRVSPADSVTVYSRSGMDLGASITIGTASVTLSQWSGIAGTIDYYAGYSTNPLDLSAPVGLKIPGGAGLEMDLGQLYNYLQRTESSLYSRDINQSVADFFVDDLGRSASSGDLSNWYSTLYNTGSDISLRETLAGSQEAINKLSASFQNSLNRPIDSGTIAWAQKDLVSAYLTQASWLSYLAYTPEAAADLNTAFQNILSRGIDAATQANAQAGLANGSLTQAGWLSSVAFSPEAAADINAIYQNDLGRSTDAGSLPLIQNYLAAGGTMQAELASVADSPEAANAMNARWIGETGQAIDPGNQSYWQQQFAAGGTLSSLESILNRLVNGPAFVAG